MANGSLENEFCLQKGFFFHFYDCWEKSIFYEIILVIHLLTKDSDIHSHLATTFLGSSFQNSFPQDSVRSWATETRSNSEYQAPRSSRCHDAMPRCQCWLVTWHPLAPVGKSTAKHGWPVKIQHHFFRWVFFTGEVDGIFPCLCWLIREGIRTVLAREFVVVLPILIQVT